MSRNVLFVLLLTTGVVLAGPESEAGQAAGAPEAQSKTEATPGQPAEPPSKTTEEQGQSKEAQAQTQTGEGAKLSSTPGSKALGMSILGNEEAPKALVIVPWKTSELGSSLGIAPMLDDSRQPVDREVFMRSLRYYEMQSTTTGQAGAPAGSDATQQGAAAPRRK